MHFMCRNAGYVVNNVDWLKQSNGNQWKISFNLYSCDLQKFFFRIIAYFINHGRDVYIRKGGKNIVYTARPRGTWVCWTWNMKLHEWVKYSGNLPKERASTLQWEGLPLHQLAMHSPLLFNVVLDNVYKHVLATFIPCLLNKQLCEVSSGNTQPLPGGPTFYDWALFLKRQSSKNP